MVMSVVVVDGSFHSFMNFAKRDGMDIGRLTAAVGAVRRLRRRRNGGDQRERVCVGRAWTE